MTGAWRIAARNVLRNRRRSVATGLAIALGHAVLVVLGGYAARVEGLLRTATVYLQRVGHLAVYRPGGLERAAAKPAVYSFTPDEQRGIAAVLAADTRVELFGRYLVGGGLVGNGCDSRPFRAVGVEREVERRLLAHPEVRRWTPDLGRPVAGVPLADASGADAPVAHSFGLAGMLGKRAAAGGVPGTAGALDCGAPTAADAIASDPVVQLAAPSFDGALSALDAIVGVPRADLRGRPVGARRRAACPQHVGPERVPGRLGKDQIVEVLDKAVHLRSLEAMPRYLYAIPALVGPASGTTSTSLKPASLHHEAKSAPVKSNASPNSISMLSDMRRPNAFSRRASSMKFSMTM
jgi:hypothetical protein